MNCELNSILAYFTLIVRQLSGVFLLELEKAVKQRLKKKYQNTKRGLGQMFLFSRNIILEKQRKET